MAKFAPKYSEEQRRAMVRATVDGQVSCPAAAALAGAGQLADDDGAHLAAFEVPVATVQRLAREERNRRARQGASELSRAPRGAAGRAIVDRTLDVLADELHELERQKSGGKDRDRRVASAKRIAEAAESILRLERHLAEPPPATPTGKGEGGKPRPSAEARELSQEARRRRAGAEQNDPPPTPPPEGGAAAMAPSAPDVGDQEQDDGRRHSAAQPETEGVSTDASQR